MKKYSTVCNSMYFIILVFYIDVYIHIKEHLSIQSLYFEVKKEERIQLIQRIRAQKKSKKLEKALEKVKKLNERLQKRNEKQRNGTYNEEEQKKEEEEQKKEDEEERKKEEEEEKEKEPELIQDTDPIAVSTKLKAAIVSTTFNLICVYVLLVLNIIPNAFKNYFSRYAIYCVFINFLFNFWYILHLKNNNSTDDDMKDISFFNVSAMVIFYMTLFSISFLTLLLALQNIFSKPLRLLNSMCLLLYSLFFILYAYLCYSMYVQYSYFKEVEYGKVYSDPVTFSSFKNLHEYLTYSMILNFFIYGIIVLFSSLKFVDYSMIVAIIGMLSGSFTLFYTFKYLYFALTTKIDKITDQYVVMKLCRNIPFILKCFLLGFVTIYHCYILYNS